MTIIKKIIRANLAKGIVAPIETDKSVLISTCNNPEDEFSEQNLRVSIDGNVIAQIDGYWDNINLEFALKLDVLRECKCVYIGDDHIKIEINLFSEINENLLDGITSVAGIYGIVDGETSAIYIGQSSGIRRRIKQHLVALSIGFHHNVDLQSIFLKNKFSSLSFNILEKFEGKYIGDINDRKWLERRERFWINHYKKINLSLNKTDGEFVDTKKTLDEQFKFDIEKRIKQQQYDAEHDIEVKRKKEGLKKEIAELQKIVEIEDLRLKPLREEIALIEDWLSKNKSWFSIFDSAKLKKEKLIKSEQLTQLKIIFEDKAGIYYESGRKIFILKKQLKKLRTSKQLNYRMKQKSDKIRRMIARGF